MPEPLSTIIFLYPLYIMGRAHPLEAGSLCVMFICFKLAEHTEAGVLYCNNPGNRPAGYTCQVLDPRIQKPGWVRDCSLPPV